MNPPNATAGKVRRRASRRMGINHHQYGINNSVPSGVVAPKRTAVYPRKGNANPKRNGNGVARCYVERASASGRGGDTETARW